MEKYLVPVRFICTTCGFHTTKRPDDEGMVECDKCVLGLGPEDLLTDGALGEGADR